MKSILSAKIQMRHFLGTFKHCVGSLVFCGFCKNHDFQEISKPGGKEGLNARIAKNECARAIN